MKINWETVAGLDDDLLELYDGTPNKQSSEEAAIQLSVTYELPITGHKVRNRYAELRAKGEAENRKRPFEIAYDEFNRLIGYTPKEYTIPASLEARRRRYLVLADLHIPFHDKEALAAIVRAHPTMDGVILAGDVLDCYELSRFVKERDAPLQDELAEGKAVLKTLAERYPKVWAISGNHERRSLNYFASRLPASLLFLVNYNLLEYIAHDLPNLEIVNNGNGTSHFFQLNDCVICHSETSSKVKMKPVQNVEAWLNEWRHTLDISTWRVVMQAHNHSAGTVFAQGGHLMWMELGCLATLKAVDYALRGDCKYSPPVKGYGILTQVEGKADFNETRFVPLVN